MSDETKLPAWVSTLPKAVLDKLPNNHRIEPSFGIRSGHVEFLKYSDRLRVAFYDEIGQTIWYQEFRATE